MYDIVIRGGILFDGAGRPGEAGDLAIADGRIAAIGHVTGAARKIIDAEGLAVAPGFIDIKTHSDFTLPINPEGRKQGAPGRHHGDRRPLRLFGRAGAARQGRAAEGLSEPERALAAVSRDELSRLSRRAFPPTAVNAGMLVGHNTLRLMVMGMAERAPSAAELAQMIALLEDALDAGALGMSSGLFTPPGSYAKPAEMIAFGHVLKRHNAGYFTHLRDESNKVIEAVAEAIDDRRAVRRACRDRAFQMLRRRQLGQGGDSAVDDRGRQGARPRRRLRCLSLRCGLQPAEEPAAAMGAGRRRRRHARRGSASATLAPKSAPISPATGSTIGAASRRGTA